MNKEKHTEPKQKILELMDSVADKNSAAYQQVKEALKRHDLVMDELNNMLQLKNQDYHTISAQFINKRLSMEEIIKACLSFQQISAASELNKLFFDSLMEPIEKQMTKLKELSEANRTLDEENIRLVKKQKEQLEIEIKTGCIELQNTLNSREVSNYVLKKSVGILNLNKDRFIALLTVPQSIYEMAEGSRYKGIVVDRFFGIEQAMYTQTEKDIRKFELFFDCLQKDRYLPKLLQRADLSEIDKKIYIHAAIRQSVSSLSGNEINYFRGNVDKKNSPKIAKQIAEKEIVYLIAKEVNADAAIELDEMLRGNRKKTADIMAKLYDEVPLTLAKEFIRKQVETSLDPDGKLAFYKESVRQRLTQEPRQVAELSSQAALDPKAATLTKLEQYEKIHTAFESPESKQQYDYPESKELLAGLRKCLFGDDMGRKIETILLIKQESPKEKVNVPELLGKNIEEIENLRITSGLRTVNAKTFVPAEFPQGSDEKKVHIEGLADTMFKLKAHLSNWDDKIQERVKQHMTSHLNEAEKNQVIETFKKKEAVYQIFAVGPELEKKWQRIVDTPNTSNGEDMVSLVDELKGELGGSFFFQTK